MDVDPACRCHKSNIMPDSIFSVKIAQRVIWLDLLACLCVCVCVCLGVIFWGPFTRRDNVLSFFAITILGLGKP